MKKMSPNASEDQIQKAIFESLRIMKVDILSVTGNRLSMASLLHHSPNGGKRASKISAAGKRYSPEGAKLKSMGTKSGFPDLFIFAAKCGYHGLFVELKKAKKNKHIEHIKNNIRPVGTEAETSQIEMLSQLNHQGYLAVVAYGYDAAMQVITEYLKGTIKHRIVVTDKDQL